jgi:hypothetical protein
MDRAAAAEQLAMLVLLQIQQRQSCCHLVSVSLGAVSLHLIYNFTIYHDGIL